MNIELLQVYCSDCDTWYDTSVDHETQSCENCGGELSHAHETSTQTPYMKMRADFIKAEINMYLDRINTLESTLRNECWEDI